MARTTASQSMAKAINKDLWVRAVVLVGAVILLFYLWVLVHYETPQRRNYEDAADGDEERMGQVYTVYASAMLMLIGIGILWR